MSEHIGVTQMKNPSVIIIGLAIMILIAVVVAKLQSVEADIAAVRKDIAAMAAGGVDERPPERVSLTISAFPPMPVNINAWAPRIIKQESGGDPRAESPAGARGLMQIMPATWEEWTARLYGESLPFDRAYDPAINEAVGTAYLRWIRETLRTWMGREPAIEDILAAYNGGIGRYRSMEYDLRRMPAETQDYVARITE